MDVDSLVNAFGAASRRRSSAKKKNDEPRTKKPDPAPPPKMHGLHNDPPSPPSPPNPPKTKKDAKPKPSPKGRKAVKASKKAKNALSEKMRNDSESSFSDVMDDLFSENNKSDHNDNNPDTAHMALVKFPGNSKNNTSRDPASKRKSDSDSQNEDDDEDEEDSDSDSAEEALRRISRRRSKKTKPIAVPEMNTAFRVDTNRGPPNSITTVDVLSGKKFNPSIAQQVCAFYDKAIWLPDSNTAPQLFERDLIMQQGKCGIPDVSFADPRNYEVIQEMLKRHPRNKIEKDDGKNTVMLKVVPVVTREYEQAQLRSPRGQERACVNGKNCMCNRKYGFVMKEFLLPDELEKLQAHSQVDVAVKPCLLCERDTNAYISVHIAATSFAPPPEYIIQRYRNIVNIENEYRFDDCLMTGPGIPYPVVMNKTNGYEKRTDGEEFYLTQTGYAFPDFRMGALQTGKA